MRGIGLLAAGCALGLGAREALGDSTKRLVLTLDVPDELTPEILCIVGDQRCEADKPSGCHDLMDFKEAIVGPLDGDAGMLFNTDYRVPDSVDDRALGDALRSLVRSTRDGNCSQCRPRLHPVQEMVQEMRSTDGMKGYISCSRNSREAHSGRIALTYLKFEQGSPAAAIGSIDLRGNQVAINFLHDVRVNDFMVLESIGGDYLPLSTGLGTRERGALRLTPRCVRAPLSFPGRTAQPGEKFQFKLGGDDVTRCLQGAQDPTLLWLPDHRADEVKRLEIQVTSPHGASGDRYEASWTDHLPPRPLKVQQRDVAFSWRRDCLTGKVPQSSGAAREQRWSELCPKATLPAAGTACMLAGSPDVRSTDTCTYRCVAPDAMPAFDLPTRVVFDRVGAGPDGRNRSLYRWDDTLGYSGQELTSFVPPMERRIVVSLTWPERWRSRYGNEITAVELRSDSDVTRVIPVGRAPPAWTTVLVPNATCSSRFTVSVLGTRSYVDQDQALDADGNLVLKTPRDYRDLLHWALMIGGGIIGPLNENVSPEHRSEPIGAIGLGVQLYYSRPFAGALELNLVYEPTTTAYGALYLSPRNERLITVPYHRLYAELIGTIWGAQRSWELGTLAGGGFGGSIHGDTERVGINHLFLLFGGVGRVRPSFVPGWLEVNAGFRWGEHHMFFGTDENGDQIADTFHGEPPVLQRALWQGFVALRWRLTIR